MNRLSRKGILFAASVLTISVTGDASDISSTRHNLSISGPGSVVALSEDEVCIFCHTPHNGEPDTPLWNHRSLGVSYTPYSSSTLDASPGQPTGATKLCLSCHDGTIGLGFIHSQTSPIRMAGGVGAMPAGPSNLGVSLHDDHPVSFQFTTGVQLADGQLVDPATLSGPVRLDANAEVQCTACHDAHDDSFGSFLVMDNAESGLCLACHVRDGWGGAAHNISSAGWNNLAPDPWPHTEYSTVLENACENCHNPHTAAGAERLLNTIDEEGNCLACHNGNVARTDIDNELTKFSVHPVMSTAGVHEPGEPAVVVVRHVECVDCHNPHAANDARASAPAVSGALSDLTGIDANGGTITPAANQHEVCSRCHADSPGKPAAPTARVIDQVNVRLEFDSGNPSFHPVVSQGINPDVPSLLSPYTTASLIYCTDCHNNDEATLSGGSGPNGVHGSAYPNLLGWQYETADFTIEGPAQYELCYRCHNRQSILNDESFSFHNKHIVEEETPCNVCHDPHGISASDGTLLANSHLINFDADIVVPESETLRLEFIDNGRYRGECWLQCHSKDHKGDGY